MSADYVLADGREFPENSPLPRYERDCLAEDIDKLRRHRYGSDGQRQEFDRIHRAMGNAYADRLRSEYEADRERRKAERAL